MNETAEKVKVLRTVKNPEVLKGVWRMKYRLTNRMGGGGFSGRNLTTYPDPITGQPRHLYNINGDRTNGFFIEKQVTVFTPDTNPEHRTIVDWLIGHPEVGIQPEQIGIDKDSRIMTKKSSNPRIELLNLDYEEVSDLEDEDYIDKLVGRISLDSGSQSLGIEKLRFILAKLNKPYVELKYVTNAKIEKQKLRKRLKDHIRQSVENAKQVDQILDDLDSAKLEYEIKEMNRHGIVYVANGMYKYEGVPLGTSIDSVVKYFRENPDFYADITTKLYEALKAEQKS